MSAVSFGPKVPLLQTKIGQDCLVEWKGTANGVAIRYVNEGQLVEAMQFYGDGFEGVQLVQVSTGKVLACSMWYHSVPAALECADEEKEEVADEQPNDAQQDEAGQRVQEWSAIYAGYQYVG